MTSAPSGLRLHVGIFGKRNVGKSSVMNRIIGKDASIVSEQPGATTDAVRRTVRIDGAGPVTFIDTAGLDDVDETGLRRVKATRQAMQSADVAIIVIEQGEWTELEKELAVDLQKREVPAIAAVNKIDTAPLLEDTFNPGIPVVHISAKTGAGFDQLLNLIKEQAPDDPARSHPMLKDLVNPGEVVIQVTPIDAEAPVGRILLPQVQSVREVIDAGGISIVVKETELNDSLDVLEEKPDLVVIDSSKFKFVADILPEDVALTSNSVLLARCRGDLSSFVEGVRVVDDLKDNDRILMAEACVHHPVENDIGRVQIPQRLLKYTGKKLNFEFLQGKDFPEDLSPYSLIIHCGACVFNRRQMIYRTVEAASQNIPITNYGIILAKLSGVLERSIAPFGLSKEGKAERERGWNENDAILDADHGLKVKNCG